MLICARLARQRPRSNPTAMMHRHRHYCADAACCPRNIVSLTRQTTQGAQAHPSADDHFVFDCRAFTCLSFDYCLIQCGAFGKRSALVCFSSSSYLDFSHRHQSPMRRVYPACTRAEPWFDKYPFFFRSAANRRSNRLAGSTDNSTVLVSKPKRAATKQKRSRGPLPRSVFAQHCARRFLQPAVLAVVLGSRRFPRIVIRERRQANIRTESGLPPVRSPPYPLSGEQPKARLIILSQHARLRRHAHGQ